LFLNKKALPVLNNAFLSILISYYFTAAALATHFFIFNPFALFTFVVFLVTFFVVFLTTFLAFVAAVVETTLPAFSTQMIVDLTTGALAAGFA
jgi:hypothetical protein